LDLALEILPKSVDVQLIFAAWKLAEHAAKVHAEIERTRYLKTETFKTVSFFEP
jgi:hypothetical protein